jgi:hypothetical protein
LSAKKGCKSSIEVTVWAITANRSVPYVPDVKARAGTLVELWASMKQHWKEVTMGQQKYIDRRTKPHKSGMGEMV